MNQEGNDERHLRKYLLGELEEAEQQALEERLMAGGELFDLLQVAEDELIEDYVDGTLSRDERGRFDSFFMSTPDRRRKLSFAMALKRYVTTEAAAEAPGAELATAKPSSRISAGPSSVIPHVTGWNRAFSSPYLRMAAAAVIVLGLGLGIWRVVFYQSEVQKGIAALAQAFRDERPVEARITGLGRAPFNLTRSAVPARVDSVSLSRAEIILLNEVAEHPTPTGHHALGRLYLAKRSFDQAIDEFNEALKADATNAQVHSDYGAALLEKGRSFGPNDKDGRSAEAFSQALEHFDRALSLDLKLDEALFNRALLREQLRLPDRALEDWRAYIERDSTSPCAEEARRHIARLEEDRNKISQRGQDLVRRFLEADMEGRSDETRELFCANREKLWFGLLGVFLNDSKSRKGNTGSRLEALAKAGELDERLTGDKFTSDLVRFYRDARPHQLAEASRALQLNSRAEEAYRRGSVENAVRLRKQASQIFSEIGDQCSSRLERCWLALHFWELGRTRQSQSLVDELLRTCEADGYEWLRARALHVSASVSFKMGYYSEALEREKEAQVVAERLGDYSLVSNTLGAAVEYYRILGNRTACFREIAAIQPLLSDSRIAPLSRWRQYEILAAALFSFGYPVAGIDYQTEALVYAQAGGFVTVSYSLSHLGTMYSRLKRYNEALGAIQESHNEAAAHLGEYLGHLMTAYADIQMGHLLMERGQSSEARQKYESAIESHEVNRLDFPTHLYQAYKGRLACCIAMADVPAAQSQWDRVVKFMDQHRSRISEEDNRDSFFDVEQSAFDLGIDLAYSLMNDEQKAFEYAEDSRARSLLDSMTGTATVIERSDRLEVLLDAAGQPLELSSIQKHVPRNARLLEYAVLDNKLIIWVVSGEGLRSKAVPESAITLSAKVTRFLSNLQNPVMEDPTETERLARELFAGLIKPIEEFLGDCDRLIIVPDKILNRVPWDALVSPSGRFLIKDYEVTPVPSASLFVLCSELAAENKVESPDERILSVGDPSFDETAFPELKRMDSAVREAEKVAAFYGGRPLVGAAAKKPAIREALTHVDVAHFALHCVIDERSPMRSSLVLAKPTGDGVAGRDGELRAIDICGLTLRRIRLVVLSACSTAGEQYYRGEGMIGLARAFLAAKVPLVVGSLWPVDSEASADLMIRFHQNRKEHQQPTAGALRSAKLGMLEGSDVTYRHPYYWAAFQLTGGQASF
ncbi:MAG: CHAT domain-containing protein [Acidobacteriota bacterium]